MSCITLMTLRIIWLVRKGKYFRLVAIQDFVCTVREIGRVIRVMNRKSEMTYPSRRPRYSGSLLNVSSLSIGPEHAGIPGSTELRRHNTSVSAPDIESGIGEYRSALRSWNAKNKGDDADCYYQPAAIVFHAPHLNYAMEIPNHNCLVDKNGPFLSS